MNSKDLVLNLISLEYENDVENLLKKEGLWDDNSIWHEVAGSVGNYSTIGNQQESAVSALVEKIVNSVDAVLIKECLKRGVDPSTIDAPSSIVEAQNKYFGIYEGNLANITSSKRTEIARNIYLIASGDKTRPCISILDKGEGQDPKDFVDTFLSLTRGNKNKINFVQGKHGMGGSGVLRFTSDKYYLQLILSKRNHEIPGNHSNWGFTIMRRFRPEGQMRSSVFKFLAPNKNIISFSADSLPLIPNQVKKEYVKEDLKSGTFIKLYEYNFNACPKPGRVRSNITQHLWNQLTTLLPSIGLPITVVDYRHSNSPLKPMSGLNVRLLNDKAGTIEEGFPHSGELVIRGEKLKYSLYVFKKEMNKKGKLVSKKATYAENKEGILFCLNGQTQGHEHSRFFNNREVGMGPLQDSILVTVECSSTSKSWQEDFFMNNRERVGGEYLVEIKNKLAEFIRTNDSLKELREKRLNESVQSELESSKTFDKILENIIKNNESLSSLFISGTRLSNPWKLQDVGVIKEEYIGKKFPSYFKSIKEYPIEKPRLSESSRSIRVQFETDVENDYLYRDHEPGSSELLCDHQDSLSYSLSLRKGVATLSIDLDAKFEINNIYKFTLLVNDISQIEPLVNKFFIQVTPYVESTNEDKGKRKETPSEEKGDKRKIESGFNPPIPKIVRRAQWDEYDFNQNSALTYQNAGERGYIFYINLDNIDLQNSIKINKKIKAEIQEKRYAFCMILVAMALIKANEDNKIELGEDTEEMIRRITASISPIVLPSINDLGNLNSKLIEELEFSTDSDEIDDDEMPDDEDENDDE